LLTGPSPRALAGVNGCWRASRLGPGRAAAVCGHGHGYMHADGDALMCTFAAPLQHEQPRWAPTARVHPTALVSPLATLGEHVVVGPFCTVGPEVRCPSLCPIRTPLSN
jgi:UDP-3-O-[3-hydroxymyristoyl] glucosamine N-acyltransferase